MGKTIKPIAVILARSGSKGLIDKNIKHLAGKPLILHSVDIALASGLFSDVWVNSDSQAYLNLCEDRPVKTYLRPDELAQDHSSSLETLTDFLKDFSDNQAFVLLQPTSPYREICHLTESWELFQNEDADHLISFVKASHSRSLYTQIREGNFIQPPEVDKHYARQKEPVYYYPNGSIWISTKGAYLRDQGFYTEKTVAYLMEKKYSYDIDDEDDFQFLDYLMKK